MNIYKTIMWFSIVIILGEGLLLSNFDFVPIKAAGKVLGETTELWWEQIASQHYPASYYSKTAIEAVVKPQSKQDIVVSKNKTTISKKNLSQPETNTVNENNSKKDLNKMIEFLNIPSDQDFFLTKTKEPVTDIISTLINKNKRVYLKDVKKELDQISQDFKVP